MKFWLTFFGVNFSVLSFFGEALGQSGIQICNDQPQSMRVAFGVETQGDITTLGWVPLRQGDCTSDLAQLFEAEGEHWPTSATYIYIHARNRLSFPSHILGQGLILCVDEVFDTFLSEFATSTCAKRGYVDAEFSRVEIGTDRQIPLSQI